MEKKIIPYKPFSKNYDVVIAIDFGTARSGFAFAFFTTCAVHVYSLWDRQPLPYPKTPTRLAYRSDNHIDFGWTASKEFLQKNHIYKPHYLFQKFKMDLSPFKENHDGGIPTMKLVADYLHCIKEKALFYIFEKDKLSVNRDRILWRLTIPAIFMSIDAKKRMVQAAVMAGIIPTYDESIIVSEPEVAAVYCNLTREEALKPTETLLVVDAGGGTVDITSYEVQYDKTLKELTATTSEDTKYKCGSTYVDDAFLDYLSSLFGNAKMVEFERANPVGFADLMDKWETFKCSTIDPENEKSRFELTGSFYKYLRNHANEKFNELVIKQEGKDEEIIFNKQTLNTAIFGKVLGNVIKCIEEHQKKMLHCDYIFLVGGFANSKHLQKAVNDKFGKSSKIICPLNPEQAVLKGAVMYGLNPTIIHSRKSNLTYGVSSTKPFEQGDPPSKKIKTDSGFLCDDTFSIFCKIGADVPFGKTKTITYTPVHNNQTALRFKVYTTAEKEPKYIDGSRCEGEFTIQLQGSGLNRYVSVTFHFDGKSIRITAEYNGQISNPLNINFEPVFAK